MSVAVAGAELEDAPSEQCSSRGRRRDAWSATVDRPLMVASLLFVFVLCAPVLWPHMSRWESDAVNAANIAIWALFAIDYGVRLHLADSKRHHVRHHVLDLIVVA